MNVQEILLSKKFIITALLIVLSFVLVLVSKVTSVDWFEFVKLVGAGYLAGNAVDKINDTVKDIADMK